MAIILTEREHGGFTHGDVLDNISDLDFNALRTIALRRGVDLSLVISEAVARGVASMVFGGSEWQSY